MVARRIVLSLLAFALLSVTIIPTVHADGTPPGTIGDKNIHPWDNNDDYVIGDGPFLTFRRPVIWIVELYSGRGFVTWNMIAAARSQTEMNRTVRFEKVRTTRNSSQWRQVGSK